MRQLARASPTDVLGPLSVTFKPLPDHDLQQLADEQLIAYIREARDDGELAHARRGPVFLVYGYERDVKRRLSIRVPAHVVDDLAHDALVRRSPPRSTAPPSGSSAAGCTRSSTAQPWIYFRRAERRPKETILPSEHAGDDDVWGAEPQVESEAGAVELRMIVDEVLEHVQREAPAGDRAPRVLRAHRR